MNRLNIMLLWAGVFLFGLLILILSFYVASILLPIILIIIVFTALMNLIVLLYRKYLFKKKIVVEIKSSKSNPDIIDAEYEIMDDNKK